MANKTNYSITAEEIINSIDRNKQKLEDTEKLILNLVYANAIGGNTILELRNEALTIKKSISKQTQILEMAGIQI